MSRHNAVAGSFDPTSTLSPFTVADYLFGARVEHVLGPLDKDKQAGYASAYVLRTPECRSLGASARGGTSSGITGSRETHLWADSQVLASDRRLVSAEHRYRDRSHQGNGCTAGPGWVRIDGSLRVDCRSSRIHCRHGG